MTNWPAPRAHSPVDAVVPLPGSKSLTNRLLVLAALADGPSRLVAPLRARDTLLMADALRSLGADIVDAAPEGGEHTADVADWVITPGAQHAATVDTGLAGTVMRFVPPVAGLADGPVSFDGDAYARERPMATLLDGLRQCGIEVDDAGTGRLPFTVHGSGSVPGGMVAIDSSMSSQFVSGLLLAAPRFDDGIVVRHIGSAPVPSTPHLTMTLALLRSAGVQAEAVDGRSWHVNPGTIRSGMFVVEPDLSNAAPMLAAAMITIGSVRIPRWPAHTTQPGDVLRELLAQMGAEVTLDDTGLTVRGTGTITGLDADLRDVSELVPTLAALAALADSPSTFSGLAHMRGHETDRLAALHAELTSLGCAVTEHPDALTITPRRLHGGTWRAYADHRMATAGAVLGLAVDGVDVDDIGCTNKTLPDFPGMWSEMLAA